MHKVRITVVRKTEYPDLMAQYENPIQHACDLVVGQSWISENGERPEGLCESAWGSMREFVESLAEGKGNFFDGWMKNPMSAMISCNDGFRPVSFYLELITMAYRLSSLSGVSISLAWETRCLKASGVGS